MAKKTYWREVSFPSDKPVNFDNTQGIQIPSGIQEVRPQNPVNGTLRYNQTIGQFEFYSNGWKTFESGNAGKSAYEVALDFGFVGTEQEWLDSLKGKDAYQLALELGFEGTENDWLEYLKGAQGDQGPQGLSAYEVAVAEGFVGDVEAWLESLIGETGPQGEQGIQGEQGVQGPQGEHAPTFNSIADLRNTTITDNMVILLGYYAPGDGGGGVFYRDTTDSTSIDNGGSVIVATNNIRWKRNNKRDISNVRCWGAKGDGTSPDHTSFMACITYHESIGGGTIYVPVGDYPVDLQVAVGGIDIICEPGTVLRARSSAPVIQINATSLLPVKIANAHIRGVTLANDGVISESGGSAGYIPATALHGIAVYGPNVTVENCKVIGCRYDSLYGRVAATVNGGWANFRSVNTDWGDAARNVVSIVDGHGWYFTGGRVWNEGKYWNSIPNTSLYLFDIEPTASQASSHVYCDGVSFLAGSPVSGSHQFITGHTGTADGLAHVHITNCYFGAYGTNGISVATIRTRGDMTGAYTKGFHVSNTTFEGRMIANAAPSTLQDCHFTDISLGGHPLFDTWLGEGTSFTNVTRRDGITLSLVFETGAKVSIKNCTGHPDRLPQINVVGSANIVGVDSTAGFSTRGTTAGFNGASDYVVWTKNGNGTIGTNIQQVVITPDGQSVGYYEVTITSQAFGSSQAGRARMQRMAFLITRGNTGAPVIDMVPTMEIAEILSSPTPVGDRAPGNISPTATVVGNTVVISTNNSVTSGTSNLVVTIAIVAMGRAISRTNFA